jgi:hypothetical protein
VNNVYTGNYAYGGRGGFYNQNTGVAGAGRKVTVGNQQTGNSATAGRGTVYNPNTGNATHVSGIKGDEGGIVNVNGHVIAGHDGNVYRPDGQGGWETPSRTLPATGYNDSYNRQDNFNNQQWNRAESQSSERLNNEFNAQELGAQRQQTFQENRPSFSGGGFRGGGGGFRGGGRR